MKKRLAARHVGMEDFTEALAKMHKIYEGVEEDERNAYTLHVDENMSEEDVINKALEMVGK